MEKQKETKSIDLLKPIKRLTKKFHLTLFFILVAGGLAGAILVINSTLQENSQDPNYTSSISAGSIDQVTLDKLNALHTSAQNVPAPTLPAGRINPVSE